VEDVAGWRTSLKDVLTEASLVFCWIPVRTRGERLLNHVSVYNMTQEQWIFM
jgi:hypothetical protein